jgi:hypothetical protein
VGDAEVGLGAVRRTVVLYVSRADLSIASRLQIAIVEMPYEEFSDKFSSLPWEYGGKK